MVGTSGCYVTSLGLQLWLHPVIRELKHDGGRTEASPQNDIILCFAHLHLKFTVVVLLFLELYLTLNVIRIPYNTLTPTNYTVTISKYLLFFDMFRPLQAI
jgi:hypothetical protein